MESINHQTKEEAILLSLSPAKLAVSINRALGGKAELDHFLPYPLDSISNKSEQNQTANNRGLQVIRKLAKESKLPTFVLAVFAKEIENG